MAVHNDFGKIGEQKASEYLVAKGYCIRERNWKHGKLEIDIIAVYRGFVVFVEVKTRSSDLFAQPKDAVNMRKMKNIVRAANAYILRNNIELEPRFDIIEIIGINGNMKIEHTEDAFVSPIM